MPETNDKDSQTAELLLFPGCDPKNRLSDLFIYDTIAGKPELVILNWLVALPTAIDPAFAAQSVLTRLNAVHTSLSADQKNVITLLAEIACHPREKHLKQAPDKIRNKRHRQSLMHFHKRTRF